MEGRTQRIGRAFLVRAVCDLKGDRMAGGADSPFRALVIGGSVGGLAAAHELRGIGAQVAVYERSAQQMQARGAGVVMQPEVELLLHKVGRTAQSVSVGLTERQMLHPNGDRTAYRAPQLMTAWDTLYKALREPIQDVCYRTDSALEAISVAAGKVSAEFGDGYASTGDLMVAADGVNSTARVLLGSQSAATYSGYLAWRGLEAESLLPEDLVNFLSDKFSYFAIPGMQMLCYLVPGVHGQRSVGERRVNWVWYVNTAEDHLDELLTGRSGRHYTAFLPPGELGESAQQALRELAQRWLPTEFARLVHLSSVFMQPVQDLSATRMLADRAVVLGDAAGTVRPHTASGTSKAFGDAASLAQALSGWEGSDDVPTQRLRAWETARRHHLNSLAQRGIQMAHASGLGTRGAPSYWPT